MVAVQPRPTDTERTKHARTRDTQYYGLGVRGSRLGSNQEAGACGDQSDRGTHTERRGHRDPLRESGAQYRGNNDGDGCRDFEKAVRSADRDGRTVKCGLNSDRDDHDK